MSRSKVEQGTYYCDICKTEASNTAFVNYYNNNPGVVKKNDIIDLCIDCARGVEALIYMLKQDDNVEWVFNKIIVKDDFRA